MESTKVLLVDDEAEFRKATGQALSRRGFEMQLAESGEQALELCRAAPPDLVILDLRMEGMDGLATLTELRKDHPDLPVVILTGHGGLDEAVTGIQLRIVDFLQKPVEIAFLAARIRALLARGKQATLKERTIADLMVPASAYQRVQATQSVREVIGVLRDELFKGDVGKVIEQGRRTVLVFDAAGGFLGPLRLNDILALMLPSFLRDSDYASYFTGMFLAQSKVVGKQLVGELVEPTPAVQLHAPLMEAVALMVRERLINLPVFSEGKLVGMLRDKDLLLEVATSMIGEAGEGG
jgi:DNA-binding response OmpR family regulator